jgi:F-type H+-transporting ATPase subunit b
MTLIDNVYASEAVHETAEAEGASSGGGILGSMGINAPLFGFQLLNFAIVFVILWFLILKPLSKKLTERQKMIDDSIENSKKIDEMLRQSEIGFQEKIDMAKSEASMILERAKTDADSLSESTKMKTREEIDALVDQAKKKINAERDQMIGDLKTETASLVIAAVEKILSEKIDENKDKKLISEALTHLDYEKK